MESITLFARAKINPILNVIGKLDNGYHNLEMVMQAINLYDNIKITKTLSNKITVSSNLYWLPTDERNLVYKTAQYLKDTYNIKYGVNINLFKRIPVSAGLAGGSTDCAATLIGIRNLFKIPISNDELLALSSKFGADVPFCLKRGTCLAKNIGDDLTKLPPFPYSYIVIAKPLISVSTSSIFNALDISKIKYRADVQKMIYFLQKGDLRGICDNLGNNLEIITLKFHPIIGLIKQTMLDTGALGSLMSGSGSAVFGIFKSKKQAVLSAKLLRQKYRFNDVFVTTPFNDYNK